jgi:urea transport system permease protein
MARSSVVSWLGRLGAFAIVTFVLAKLAYAAPGPFESALGGLSQPSPEALTQAAEAIAKTEDPRALRVLQALLDGDVVANDSGRVYLKDKGGALRDAATGEPSGGELCHEPPVDNGVRRVLGSLITQLQLRDPDAAVRLAAVEDLARRANAEDAAALRQALARERDKSVQRAITSALAELDLASDDPAQRIGAIKAIEAAGATGLRPKLQALVLRNDDGSYAEADARVRSVAEGALRTLDRKQFFIDRAADILYGLSTGSILLLTALGLAITFGQMGVINMAHGEMLMLGAYSTYVTQLFFRAHFPQHTGLYIFVAVPFALVTTMAVGALLERTVIRFLYGRPLETLLATWGLSLLLIQIVRTIFGAQNVAVENPLWLSGGTEIFEGVVLPFNRIAVVLFTVVVVSFVAYVLRGTSLGLQVRAVMQNRPMAACMGIPTSLVDTWTFALGSGVGGLGGVALSQLGNVGPELGQGYIVDAFLVVVLGGVGKLVGTVVAAFSLGILNKLLEPMTGAVLGKIVVLLAVVLVIQKRPQGLFASRVRGMEAG